MEKISLEQLAKKLNTKTETLVAKLKLIGIEVSSSSRLDEITILKATLLLLNNPRVDDIAKTMKTSTDKLLNKLSEMGISVLSHLSIINQNDLVNFLKQKNFNKFEDEESKKSKKKTKKNKLKKQKRVFEVAEDLNISEKLLLKKLKELHIFATHRRSPVDEKTIYKVKESLAKSHSLKARFLNLVKRIASFFTTSFNKLAGSKVTLILISSVLAAYLIFTAIYTYSTAISYPTWKLGKITMPESKQTYQQMKTIGILEIHKSDKKLPIAEEGAFTSDLSPTLIYQKKSPIFGNQGITILTDTSGDTYKTLNNLIPGDILIVTLLNENKYYYKIDAGDVLSNVTRLPLKSGLHIKVNYNGKVLEVKSILQKSD